LVSELKAATAEPQAEGKAPVKRRRKKTEGKKREAKPKGTEVPEDKAE
jgi:hypothetical protein